MTDSDNAGSSNPDIAELEARFEEAKAAWESRLAANSRATHRLNIFWRLGQARRVRRSAAELERARLVYAVAWRALQNAKGPARSREGRTDEGARRMDEGPGRTDPVPAATEPSPQAEVAVRPVSLSKASFDELREIGMSVTQARRVIRHREAHGGFADLNDLDGLPGFPADLLVRVKRVAVP